MLSRSANNFYEKAIYKPENICGGKRPRCFTVGVGDALESMECWIVRCVGV
jgi:hypothetical protein